MNCFDCNTGTSFRNAARTRDSNMAFAPMGPVVYGALRQTAKELKTDLVIRADEVGAFDLDDPW